MLFFNALLVSICLIFLPERMVNGKSLFDQNQHMKNYLSTKEFKMLSLMNRMKGLEKQPFKDELTKEMEVAEIKSKNKPMKHLEMKKLQPMQQQKQQPMTTNSIQQQPMLTNSIQLQPMPTNSIQQQTMPTQSRQQQPMSTQSRTQQPVQTQTRQQQPMSTQSRTQQPVQTQTRPQHSINYQHMNVQQKEKSVKTQPMYYQQMQKHSVANDITDLMLPNHKKPISTLLKVYHSQSFTPRLKPQLAYQRYSFPDPKYPINSPYFPIQYNTGPYTETRLDRWNRRYNVNSKLKG